MFSTEGASTKLLFLTLLCSHILPCSSSTSRTQGGEDPEEIVKSESDDNKYRAVTLSNKIRCVLVSDRTTEAATVVLSVGK